MRHNVQLSVVCPNLVKSTNVAKLPNPHNGIHEEVRSESQKPERKMLLEAMKYQNE